MKQLLNLSLALLLLFIQPLSRAAEALPSDHSGINHVSVSVRLISIDSIDVTKGTYQFNIYLGFTCEKDCPKFNLNFFHGTINKTSFMMSVLSPKQIIYHLQLLIEKDFYSVRYPFDGYWLDMSIIDEDHDISKLLFVADEKHTVVPSQAILHGWNFDNKKVFVNSFEVPFLNTSFSRYNFQILITRPILMGFLKIIFPAVIILLFAFITFIIATKHSIQRLGIVSGTLISSILLHLNISSSLPLLSYLTYVDSFMIINYLIFFIILFENVYVMRLIDEEKVEKATQFDRISLLTIPLFWFCLELLCILFFIYRYPIS
ncbi:MAG: hypothetical protein WC785_08390 [Tatlockia sp.]|jgi:hypothetical protein